jgi:hypothetical protein
MDHHWRHSCSLGKKKAKGRQAHHSLSPETPALAKDLQETSSDSDDYGEDKWDPHASTKPSPLDGEALDEQWDPRQDSGDEGEDIDSEDFNDRMVKMISELQDDDLCDQEWKPKGKQKTIVKCGQLE